MVEAPRPTVSVIIKALNEERLISMAIESALAALGGLNGEVILADSASDDDTVDVAAKFPIKIVSLMGAEDRSCGAGVQLGYQYSSGRYVCLIDGDMRLSEGFLSAGIRYLEDNADVAGVSGLILEHEQKNLEYVRRVQTEYVHHGAGLTDCLEGGAIYRREAIQSVGYFGDRNVHMWEDVDLAVRLQAKGWKLARMNVLFVDHFGHSGNAYRLLVRRWQTRFAFGIGEMLRGSLERGYWPFLLRQWKWFLSLLGAVHLWWICLLAIPFLVGSAWAGVLATATLLVLPFALMSARRRSVRLGVYSVAAWNVYAAGIWPGLLQRRIDPADWIESTVIRDRTGPASAGADERTPPAKA
jgi:glycosyltransferase involved in cell wall biosynthesis